MSGMRKREVGENDRTYSADFDLIVILSALYRSLDCKHIKRWVKREKRAKVFIGNTFHLDNVAKGELNIPHFIKIRLS